MNKFFGIGRNAKDGELRKSGDISIYTNTLAMTNNFKNKNGEYDSEFLNYVAYRAVADILSNYTGKGTQVCLEGRIHTRSYEDKDKVKRYVTELIVETATILEKKKRVESEEKAEEPKTESKDEVKLSDEDIDKAFNADGLELPF